MSNILSVSVSKEQLDFLDEVKLSPSKILQKGIDELIESSKVNVKQVLELNRRIGFLQATIAKQRDFIEGKGLMAEFIQC